MNYCDFVNSLRLYVMYTRIVGSVLIFDNFSFY